MSFFYKQIIQIISQPPCERKESEILNVIPWLAKKSSVFNGTSKDIMIDIIRHCQYHRYQRDDIIIMQGAKGNEFYIMLSGRTSIYIDGNMTGENLINMQEDKDEELGQLDEEVLLSSGGNVQGNGVPQMLMTSESELDRKKLGKFIACYESGKSFGEIALMTKNAIRNATIVADEDSDLLVVSSDLFNRAFKAQQEREYKERQVFIASSVLFKWWQPRLKRLLEMSLRKEQFACNGYIARQGQPLVGLHFILKGTVRVQVVPLKHYQQFPQYCQKLDETGQPETRKLLGLKVTSTQLQQRFTQQETIYIRRHQGYANAEKRQFERENHLVYIHKGDIIGDIELVAGINEYACSYVAESEVVETLILDAKNIERLFQRRNKRTLQILQETVLDKMIARTDLESTDLSCHVPLFERLEMRLQEQLDQLNFRYAEKRMTNEERKISNLIQLYLLDKVPLVENSIPDAIHHRMLSHKQSHFWQLRMEERDKTSKSAISQKLTPRRKKPRSALQLKQITKDEQKTLIGSKACASKLTQQGGLVERIQDTGSLNVAKLMLENTTMAHEDGQHISLMIMLRMIKRLHEVRQRLASRLRGIKPSTSLSTNSMEKRPFTAPLNLSATQSTSLNACCESTTQDESSHKRPSDSADTYFDWETSDEVLQDIETRLASFLKRFDGDEKNLKNVARLQRYNLKPYNVPLPGGTVLVRRKLRPVTALSETGTRHHMLPRNALNLLQSYQAMQLTRDLMYKNHHHHVQMEKSLTKKFGHSIKSFNK